MSGYYTSPQLDSTQLIASINSYDREQLQKLVDDDNKVKELVFESQQVKNLVSSRDELLRSTRQMAEHNLSQRPQLEESKEELINLHQQLGEALNTQQKLQAQIESLADKHSHDTILALLQAAAAEVEESSEKLADSFLDKEVECDGFLDSFLLMRKLAHERRIKCDKMNDLVTTGNSNVFPTSVHANYAASNPPPPPPSISTQNHFGNSAYQLPYPTTGGAMPLPYGNSPAGGAGYYAYGRR
jgi:ESCRT-I complex subunit VPS37